jgi:hypothetical protein
MVALLIYEDKRNEVITLKQKRDFSSKPYYRCFICPRFRKECGGRPTRDMDLKEWSEYMRDIRDYFGLTNDYITEKADSSDGTTERIMSANPKQDVMRATARRYEQATIGPVGEFICFHDLNHTAAEEIIKLQEELVALQKKCEKLEMENDRKAKIIDKLLG